MAFSEGRGSLRIGFRGRFRNCRGLGDTIPEAELFALS